MFCEIDIILDFFLDISHIHFEYGICMRISIGMFSVP